MEDKSKSLSLKFDSKIDKIKEREKSLKKKTSAISEIALEPEIKQIEKDKKAIHLESQEESKKLQKVYFDTISTMNKKMSTIVETYAKKNKINVIFEASGLIFSDLNNVTDDVIMLMNENLPSFKVSFED